MGAGGRVESSAKIVTIGDKKKKWQSDQGQLVLRGGGPKYPNCYDFIFESLLSRIFPGIPFVFVI